jgi:hypothetical protein
MHKVGIALSLSVALAMGCVRLEDQSPPGGASQDPSTSGTPAAPSTGSGSSSSSASPTTAGTTTTSPTGTVSLSLAVAPAPTQTFYWGTVDVNANGFAGTPSDTLTISLDETGELHYLGFKTFPMLTKTFGDAPDQYPVAGTKDVAAGEPSGYPETVTVLENPTPTSSHFLLSYHVVIPQFSSDFVESTEGTLSGNGWAITYSEIGTFDGVAMNATATGTIYAGDPNAPAPVAGQAALWSAPVETGSTPVIAGVPVDHLTIGTDAQGQIASLAFQQLMILPRTYGTGTNDFPLSGTGMAWDRTITVDNVTPPDPNHFMIESHIQSSEDDDDYEEGIDGTLMGNGLVVRYFMQGKLEGLSIDLHAAGTLVPAEPAE